MLVQKSFVSFTFFFDVSEETGKLAVGVIHQPLGRVILGNLAETEHHDAVRVYNSIKSVGDGHHG